MPGRSRGRPRKRRRDKSTQRAPSPPPKKRRKQWTDEAMVAAMEAVRNGAAIKRAAVDHGVPRSTLQDRIGGRVAQLMASGRAGCNQVGETEYLSGMRVDRNDDRPEDMFKAFVIERTEVQPWRSIYS